MSSYLKRFMSLTIIGAMLLCTGCSTIDTVQSVYEVTEALLGDVDDEQLSSNRFTQLEPSDEKPLPEYKLDGYEIVAENDNLALYVKEEKASIRVLNKKTGYVWGALENEESENLNKTWESFAQSIVSISYMDNTGATKQIGAGHEDATCKFDYFENGFKTSVKFEDDIDISLEVEVTLAEDHVRFSVDDSTIKEEGEFFVNMIYFTPFLGSTVGNQTNGYLFVPDGSGALLRYQEPAKYLKAYSGRVYGIDYAIDNLGELNDLASKRPRDFLKDISTVTMPVFGLTHGVNQEALFGRVTSGDSYAYISATPAGVSTDYNWASASFVYRQVYSQPTSKNGAGVPVVQANPNIVNPTMEIYFLSGEDANYSGMANLYADILKEEKILLDNMKENAPEIALDFVLADIEEGMLRNSVKEITSAEYVKYAVDIFEKEGISQVALTLQGWQDGGLNGYQKGEIYTDTVLGSFAELDGIKAALQKINGELYLYADPLRAKEVQINSRQDAGITLSQSTITKVAVDSNEFLGDTWYLKTNLAMNYLRKQMEVVIASDIQMVIDGANLLYGEYLVDDFVTREATKTLLTEAFAKLAEDEFLTLYNPNQYLLPYTSVYRNIPVSGSQDLYQTDSVPFIQMVLSGNMSLIAPYANDSFYSKIDLLKCIEYNVYPSYILTEAENVELSDTTIAERSSTRFNDWQATIRESYFFVKNILEQVKGQQMLKHERLNETVFAVTYDEGIVYVNYGDEPLVLENGTEVPAENGIYVPNM